MPFDKAEILQFIVLSLAIALVTLGIWMREHQAGETAPELNAQNPASQLLPSGDIEVTLKSKKNGHYRFIGEINGQAVTFFYDTGASHVAIPEGIANYLSLTKGYPYQTQTANGTSTSFSTRLDSIKVGGIELNNIAAGISPGLRGNEILLGMSFLRHVEISQNKGILKLTYSQHNQTSP